MIATRSPKLDRLIDVVGDHDDGLAQLALQSEEKLMQLATNDRIQPPRTAHP
jgi:hypothetical protein